MASLFNKFQQAVKVLAKSPTFAKDPRQMQFEADINRLFLYTSYNRLGRDAEEGDAEEIIEMGSKTPLSDQQKQVQENIHNQLLNFSQSVDKILVPDKVETDKLPEAGQKTEVAPARSGLSFAIGGNSQRSNQPVIPETRPLKLSEVSQKLKEHIGYTLDLRPSQIPHKEAGQGLFLDGEADIGSVIAIYPGVVYSPAYYRFIPGYPRVDAHNSYLITRYDGTVINAQPWGCGAETRQFWDGSQLPDIKQNTEISEKGTDRVWKALSKPLETKRGAMKGEVLERRNPLALAHYANHPAKGMEPNVMICPYDFPLTTNEMRPYIPNVLFGDAEEVNMRRFGSFWFKSRGWKNNSSAESVPILKTLVLVATKALCNEEVLLNYRLSNSKRRPAWYTPVNEEEDQRRWS